MTQWIKMTKESFLMGQGHDRRYPEQAGKMTDEEFLAAIDRLGMDILSKKAAELVRRPATKSQLRAYERALANQREWNRNHRAAARDRKKPEQRDEK